MLTAFGEVPQNVAEASTRDWSPYACIVTSAKRFAGPSCRSKARLGALNYSNEGTIVIKYQTSDAKPGYMCQSAWMLLKVVSQWGARKPSTRWERFVALLNTIEDDCPAPCELCWAYEQGFFARSHASLSQQQKCPCLMQSCLWRPPSIPSAMRKGCMHSAPSWDTLHRERAPGQHSPAASEAPSISPGPPEKRCLPLVAFRSLALLPCLPGGRARRSSRSHSRESPRPRACTPLCSCDGLRMHGCPCLMCLRQRGLSATGARRGRRPADSGPN